MGRKKQPVAVKKQQSAERSKPSIGFADIDADAFLSGNFIDDIIKMHEDEEGEEEDLIDSVGDKDDYDDDDDDDVGGGDEEEEEEEEEGADDEAADENKSLDDAEEYAQGLRDLSTSDPDFYAFLKAEEPALLDFDPSVLQEEGDESSEDGSGDDDDSDDGSGDEGGHRKDRKTANEREPTELTKAILISLQRAAFVKKTIKGLKHLLSAFRSGCSSGSDGDEEISRSARRRAIEVYTIEDPDVYNDLMLSCLQNCHKAFILHIFPAQISAALALAESEVEEGEDAEAIRARKEAAVGALHFGKEDFQKASKQPHWRSLQPMLYGFLKSLLRLVSEVPDKKLQRFILQNLQHYTPLMVPFPGAAKSCSKMLLKLWAAPRAGDDADAASLQVLSFLRLREMALSMPPPFLDECLRSAYLTYAKCASFKSENVRPSLTFMGNCLVELYGIDVAASYQHAFAYVRQLALLLRQAVLKMDPKVTGELFRWQFLNCLRLWVAVVCAYPDSDELGMMAYPTAQIAVGVAGLAKGLTLAPIRLHIVKLLHQLAAAHAIYVPTWGLLFDILESPRLQKKPKASTAAPPQLANLVSFNENAIKERPTQEVLVTEAFRLLGESLAIYRYTPALPELSIPILRRLHSYMKNCHSGKAKAMARGLVEALQRNAEYASAQRTPQTLQEKSLEGMLPDTEEPVQKRHKASGELPFAIANESTPPSSGKEEAKYKSAKKSKPHPAAKPAAKPAEKRLLDSEAAQMKDTVAPMLLDAWSDDE